MLITLTSVTMTFAATTQTQGKGTASLPNDKNYGNGREGYPAYAVPCAKKVEEKGSKQNGKADQQANKKVTTDQDIAKNVQDTLGGDWFSKGFKTIGFDVRDGTVTLRGSVDSQDNKTKVENSIKKLNGVKKVNNLLIVTKEKNK